MDRNERIVALARDQGLSDEEIGRAVGLSASSIARIRLGARILRKPHGSPPQELIDEIIERATVDGWPRGEICDTLGLTRDQVRHWMPKTPHGRDWNKVARWAARHHRELYEELKKKGA